MFLVWVWGFIATLWAIASTVLLIRNPLPFPDRGHRAYALASEEARQSVLKALAKVGLRELFTFRAGPTYQTLMTDGFTVINYLDESHAELASLPANAVSRAVSNPLVASEEVAQILRADGYRTKVRQITDSSIPPNHLVILESEAFKDWVLVLRRHVLKMPAIKREVITHR